MTFAKRLTWRPLLAVLIAALLVLIALYVSWQGLGDDGTTSARDSGTSGTASVEPGVPPGARTRPHEPGDGSLPRAGADDDPDTDPAEDERPHGVGLRRSGVGLPAGWEGVSSGRVASSRAGQVIEGLDVSVESGVGILVRHDDVTVRYNRVAHRSGANGVEVASGVRGAVVEHNEFNGHYRTESGNSGSIGVVAYGQAEIVRNFFQGGRDGVHVYGANSRVIENWVDDLHQHSGAHNDGIYLGGRRGTSDIVIARNRTVAGNSGGIDLYALYGPLQGVQVVDNLIVGTGHGFGIHGGRTFDHHSDNRDIRIEGNRFEGRFGWPQVLGNGTNAAVDLSRPGNTFTNNRWVDSTTNLPPRCGVRQNACE
jgi:hypothetical protein